MSTSGKRLFLQGSVNNGHLLLVDAAVPIKPACLFNEDTLSHEKPVSVGGSALYFRQVLTAVLCPPEAF